MSALVAIGEFDEFMNYIGSNEFRIELERERAEIARATIAPVINSVRANIDALRAAMAFKTNEMLAKASMEDFANVAFARAVSKLRYDKPYVSGDDDHEWKEMIARSNTYFSADCEWLEDYTMLWTIRTPCVEGLDDEKLRNTAAVAVKLYEAGVQMNENYHLVLWASDSETTVNIKREGDTWLAFHGESGFSYAISNFLSLSDLIWYYHTHSVQSRY